MIKGIIGSWSIESNSSDVFLWSVESASSNSLEKTNCSETLENFRLLVSAAGCKLARLLVHFMFGTRIYHIHSSAIVRYMYMSFVHTRVRYFCTLFVYVASVLTNVVTRVVVWLVRSASSGCVHVHWSSTRFHVCMPWPCATTWLSRVRTWLAWPLRVSTIPPRPFSRRLPWRRAVDVDGVAASLLGNMRACFSFFHRRR